ncbi:MAG: tRNA (N(6)-L-threonylcarbamoyladenosine(37)-C(2))-methylthiotransferase MtaB [Bacteriovoracales bacterium]|nr:tRNA (N(6)-L-threonylcarbamoyladenosine(37)-C(2))-methylthiotransferase MtaB [Bacteriovoracales bacterium]
MSRSKQRSENPREKTVALHTLGCRLNSSETAMIAQGFVDRGHRIVPFGERADVVFINTCTVTDKADSTCRHLIRKAVRSSPKAKVVVAGCYAQMEAQKLAAMEGVDLVVGNSEKHKVFDYLDKEPQKIVRVRQTDTFWSAHTTAKDHHTRGFLKIQDGCDYVCSFCIIPFARGRSRALPQAVAIRKAQEMAREGFKEIVLTGVNIGEYESKTKERLGDLLSGLARIKGLDRIRLSSVEPNTITDELLDIMSLSPKFQDHFHIPLQSGSDSILKAMRRKYDVKTYRQVIEKIKTKYPHAGIGADIIAGFPGESEEDFESTFKLLEELPVTHFHVFPYSKRQKTTAAKLPEQIPYAVKKKRVQALLSLGEKKFLDLAKARVGKETSVLFEKRNPAGKWEGYSSNFIRVAVDSKENLANQILRVRPTTLGKGAHGEWTLECF